MLSVYILSDPDTKAVRYVGLTSQPGHRFLEHLYEIRGPKPKHVWMRGLLSRGILPFMQIVETAENEMIGKEAEGRWLRYFLDTGADLFNVRI